MERKLSKANKIISLLSHGPGLSSAGIIHTFEEHILDQLLVSIAMNDFPKRLAIIKAEEERMRAEDQGGQREAHRKENHRASVLYSICYDFVRASM
jgi:hypothetical protein